MARFLVGTTSLMGHIVPLAPVVAELVRRGHDVRWYTGAQYRERIEATGAVHVAPTFAADSAKPVNVRLPERASRSGVWSLLFDIEHIFTAPAVGQTLDLQEELKQAPADAIFADAAFLAAGWVHELGGPPWAVLNPFAVTLSGENTPPFGLGARPASSPAGRARVRMLQEYGRRILYRRSTRLADRLRQRVGLAPTGQMFWDRTLSPWLYMQGSIKGLEYPRNDFPPHFHFIGPTVSLAEPPPFDPPSWWEDLQSDKPVVLVTQGTLSNDPEQLLLPSLRALAGEDVLTVATTGGGSLDALPDDAIPDNARVASFIPFEHLLPLVDVMVTNGGYNGVQMALSKGVPLVLAGATEDKLETNARVVWTGAGLDLHSATPSERRIRKAVRQILGDERYRKRAEFLEKEFAEQDGAGTGADLLEELARTRKPVFRETAR